MSRIVADMHVHSTHSFDGKNSIEEMCAAAIEQGISQLCFTEHYDVNPHSSAAGYFSLAEFQNDINKCRKQFGSELEILHGVEFGEPHYHQEEFAALSQAGFDVILGAVHRVGNTPIIELAKGHSVGETFRLYYEEILAMVEFGQFDVVAHIDLPKRYLGASGSDYTLLKKIFAIMAKKGIALEINTSTYNAAVREPSPNLEIVKLWKLAGGEKLVIGSDAHSVGAVSQFFPETKELITQVGIGYGFFRKRKYQHAKIGGR